MSRLLWLAFERPPHPDAVCHPATMDDVLLILEWLESAESRRVHLSEQLRGYLAQQHDITPWSRPAVPCRRESGLYALVPWRMAKWLSHVLPASPGVIERTRRQLERWLQTTSSSPIVNPAFSS
ncbi:hypothetical protein GC163_07780 [bacterium]|nr:hypothetical protein [bacterium]